MRDYSTARRSIEILGENRVKRLAVKALQGASSKDFMVSGELNKPYYRKIRLDFRHAAAFSAMLRSFSGKSGMAMRGLSFEGIFSGTS